MCSPSVLRIKRSLRRLRDSFSLSAGVVLVIGLVVALPASVPAASFTFTPIDVPGASITEVHGINDAGQIVGFFSNPRHTSGTSGARLRRRLRVLSSGGGAVMIWLAWSLGSLVGTWQALRETPARVLAAQIERRLWSPQL